MEWQGVIKEIGPYLYISDEFPHGVSVNLKERKRSDDIDPETDEEVIVAGWVQTIRKKGKIAFILLRDRGGVVQVTALKNEMGEEDYGRLTKVQRESVIAVRGKVQKSEYVKRGFEILPIEWELLNEADAPLPMGVVDKVNVELDTRLDNRFMDLRREEVMAIFALKSTMLSAIRNNLEEKGFLEVQTPKILKAGAEGGATLFKLDYFGENAYLAQSPQLFKQILMSTGLERVYEIAPAFRAELSDTTRHLSEFTSLDFEMSFIESQDDVMDAVEEMLDSAIKAAIEDGEKYLEILGIELKAPKRPYPRISFEEAKKMLAEKGKQVENDLDTEGEKILGEIMAEKGYDAYFVVEYPEEEKPFYIMEKDGTPWSYSFDLEFRGQELASGGQREHRPDVLEERMRKKGLDPSDFEFYLKAFKYGMPPHGGVGIGVERLIQKALRLENVRETTIFPRDRFRLVP